VRESKQIALLAVVVTVLACSTYLLFSAVQITGDLWADHYNVHLTTDGRLTETFLYHVQNDHQYRMLYRYWDADVVFNGQLTTPYLQVTNVESPYTSYIKNYQGSVWLQMPNSQYESFI